MPLLSVYTVTSALFKINKLDFSSSLFKSSKPASQDAAILEALEYNNINLIQHWLPLLSLRQCPERAGRLAAAALVAGHYELAHQFLQLQPYAISHAIVPNPNLNTPAPDDVYTKAQLAGLKSTAWLWEVRAAPTDNNTLCLLKALPDELIALVAWYLQAPHRRNTTDAQKNALTYYGYHRTATVTLSLPAKSINVDIA